MRRSLLSRPFVTLVAAGVLALAAGGAAHAQLSPPPGPVAPTQATEIFSLPYAITQSGSYRLGRDLTATAESHFITVSAVDVTIDFAGHTLDGGGVATSGVHLVAGGDRVRIHNGQIRSTVSHCIIANFRAIVVEDMRISNSAEGNGVAAANGTSSIVRNVHIENVGFNGVSVSQGSLLENVIVRNAAGDGFSCNGKINIRGCVAINCGIHGFNVGVIFGPGGSVLENCLADGNRECGFRIGPSAVLRGCQATNNGHGAFLHRAVPPCEPGSVHCAAGELPHPFDDYQDPVHIDTRTGEEIRPIVTLGRPGASRTPTSGNDGIRVGVNALVEGCVSNGNFDDGIAAGAGSTIIGCTAAGNGANGFSVGERSSLKSPAARGNSGFGVAALAGSRISEAVASGNTLGGIIVGPGGTVHASSAMNNSGDGITGDARTTIRECESGENTGRGIAISGNDSVVRGCTVRSNAGVGIDALAGSGAQIDGNYCGANNGGSPWLGIRVNGTFALIVRNHLELDEVSNLGGASNRIGPIITSTDISAASPWANFRF